MLLNRIKIERRRLTKKSKIEDKNFFELPKYNRPQEDKIQYAIACHLAISYSQGCLINIVNEN